ncbi:hypothetical protein N2152v2_002383 [Parachlorella kessleri]
MEALAVPTVEAGYKVAQGSPAGSSSGVGLTSASGVLVSAALGSAPSPSKEAFGEEHRVEALPPTPPKPEPAPPILLKPTDQAHGQSGAAQDGSSSNVPDSSQAMPQAVDGPQSFYCAYPMPGGGMMMGMMPGAGMSAPFTPQRLSGLPGFQTPMHVTLAPMAVVTFQAPLAMMPGGGVVPGGSMMQQCMMAHPSLMAAAAQHQASGAGGAMMLPGQGAVEVAAPPEVSPDVLARFDAALRSVMTAPFGEPAAAPTAAEQPLDGNGATTAPVAVPGMPGATALPAAAPPSALSGTQWTQSSTGFKGVTKHKRTKRFEAHIWAHKQQVYLGSFDQGVQAARAHDIMALCNHGGVIYPGSHSALNFPPVLYAELLPFLGALSQSDVLAALRNFGKKTPAARRAAAAAAAAAAAPPAASARKRKAAAPASSFAGPPRPPRGPQTVRQKRAAQQQAAAQRQQEQSEMSGEGLSQDGDAGSEAEGVSEAVQGSARTEEGATPAPAKKASAGECEKVEGQGERGEGDADAEEAAALLHHFANGRL